MLDPILLRSISFWLVIFFVALLLVPYPTTSVHEWEVQLLNPDGSVPEEMLVEQEWSHYRVLGSSFGVEKSGETGKVFFPERTFVSPLLARFTLRTLDYVGSFGNFPHGARVGAYSRIVIKSDSYYWLEYFEGGQQSNVLIVRKLSE